MKKLEDYVISIPDFPEPGIIFRDVTSILQDPDGLKLAVDSLLSMVKGCLLYTSQNLFGQGADRENDRCLFPLPDLQLYGGREYSGRRRAAENLDGGKYPVYGA